jgi:glutaredoxin
MSFEKPSDNNYTVYSKSGCINCRKVKELFKNNNIEYEIIDCDDYLLEDKENFLLFIQIYANTECKTFPIVFCNGKFIGSFNETIKYLDEKIKTMKKENLDFTNENF